MRTSRPIRRSAGVGAAAIVITLLAQGAAPSSKVHAQTSCVQAQGPVGDPFTDCSLGQVFNIVPPGSTGTYDSADFAQFQATGTRPPHTDDQEPLYANLVKVAPNLTPDLISTYYKDASFYTDAAHAERVETFSSHPNAVILRDSQFGVPHIFGVTRSDTEFAAGYASAEDRLFEMDVLRHVGRAQLTSFIGPAASNEAMDCSVAEAAGYSEAELQAQVNAFPTLHPDPFSYTQNGVTVHTTEGQQIVDDAGSWVSGVNEYIQDAEANQNGAKLPAEYGLLQITPQNFTATDIVATATLVQAIFATGGGNEVSSALLYQSLVQRYGQAQGGAMWADFRSQNDPDARVSIPTSFNYEHVPANIDPASLAMPVSPPTDNHCSVTSAPSATSTSSAVKVDVTPLLAELKRGLPDASNELIVDAAHSATGHPIAVFGPQTGYYVPQLLHEIDLHGPGLQARGVSFAGTEVFVELGHGEDYAWSATSAGSDIIDQRLEKLCNTDGTSPTLSSTAYIFDGACTPMFERTDTQQAKPSAGSTCPPPPDNPCPPVVMTIQVERTVHGPVIGRTMATDPATGQAIPVAVSVQRSTWGDELGSAPAFLEWNDPDIIHNALDFQRAAGKETGTFNWAYVDSHDVGYYSSGKLPIRNPNVNPNFPVWGTGQWEWQGFVPTDLSAKDVHPRANTMAPTSGVVNGKFKGGFYTNWNNKQAPGFSASDSQFSYGPVYRVQSLSDRLQAILKVRLATPTDVINAMEDGGTVDLDGAQLIPDVAKVLRGATLTAAEKQVLGILKKWVVDPAWGDGKDDVPGAHRRDRSGSGSYEQGNAVAIMDELYPRLTHAIFDPWLSASQYSQLAGVNGIDDIPRAQGSAYDGGWEGYLQRSLLQALGLAKHPYSQSYCGGGSVAGCQAALLGALDSTISAMSAKYNNDANPADWTCSTSNPPGGGASEGSGQVAGVQCNPLYDDITYNAVGVGTVPGMPWVNRPTFQQVVTYLAGR
jgi:acyl-homoserine lactone acylase PvdQ